MNRDRMHRLTWRRIYALLTIPDRILIMALLVLGVVSVLLLGALRPEGGMILIQGEQGMVAKVSMGVVDTVDVPGPLGMTRIAIGPEGARIIASPCPQQLCVRSGVIHRQGDLNACVPNRVVIRISGASKNAVDAIVR